MDSPLDPALTARILDVAAWLEARATATDLAGTPPRENIDRLADAGLLGMTVPAAWGGIGADALGTFWYQQQIAAACGTTTFVLVQLLGGISLIAGGSNDALKDDLLPRLATGALRCGVAFGHVRRPGPPAVRATAVDGGYRFEGTAPWCTGWGLLDGIVLGGTLPDGQIVFAWVPLPAAGLEAGPVMRLAAMESAQTVALRLDGLVVPAEHVTAVIGRATMDRRDAWSVLNNSPYALGVAQAALRELGRLPAAGDPASATTRARQVIAERLGALEAAVETAIARRQGAGAPDEAGELAIRGGAIALAMEAAHALVAASGGAANDVTHPAQRLVREAIAYTLVSQTGAVRTATLEAITGA